MSCPHPAQRLSCPCSSGSPQSSRDWGVKELRHSLGWWIFLKRGEIQGWQSLSSHRTWPESFQSLSDRVWGCVWGVTARGHSWVRQGAKGTVQKGIRQECQAAPSSDPPQEQPRTSFLLHSSSVLGQGCTAGRAVPCHGFVCLSPPSWYTKAVWQLLPQCQALCLPWANVCSLSSQGSPTSRDSSFQDTETDSSGAPLLQVYC